MRPVPRSRHWAAVLIFGAVAAASGYAAMHDDRLSGVQVNIAAAAVKWHEPEMLAHDGLFGDSLLWRFHTPIFQSMLDMVLIPNGYADLTLPYRLMSPVAVLVFLCGMYALLYRQCRSWSVSAFTAVLSLRVVDTLGRSFWGVGPLETIAPPALCMSLAPLIVLAYLRYRGTWRMTLVFGFIGLMGNLHLVTAMNLTLVLLIVYLCERGFAPRAWPLAMTCAVCAAVGALPYTWYYFQLRGALGPQHGISPAVMAEALRLGNLPVLLADVAVAALKWLGLAWVLLVPAAAVLSRVERFRSRDLRTWICFLAAAAFISLGLHALSVLAGRLWHTAPPVIDFLEASSLLMLPLYVLFAQALTNVFRLVRTHQNLLRWAMAALAAAWLVPSDNFRVARYAVLDTATAFMQQEQKPQPVQRHHERSRQRQELAEMASWARLGSDVDALFITDLAEFRMRSGRSIVASADDVKYIFYLAPSRLGDWIGLMARQQQLLYPPERRLQWGDLTAMAGDLSSRAPFAGATEWYAILESSVQLSGGRGQEVVSPAWGSHYRLYRIK